MSRAAPGWSLPPSEFRWGAACDRRVHRTCLPVAAKRSRPRRSRCTLYRDPERGATCEAMNRAEWPQGFAMITEKRTVTLPPGESTIRFEGVAEGMVAVSAIVTGLPGGTIEKNRNADLLSPAALVDGTLGNRVTVTRTNPATRRRWCRAGDRAHPRRRRAGAADQPGLRGGALRRHARKRWRSSGCRRASRRSRCSASTRATRAGGTYAIELTYLAWGFDWQAHYVATLEEPGRGGDVKLRLMMLADAAQRQRPELPRCRAAGGRRHAQRGERFRRPRRAARARRRSI